MRIRSRVDGRACVAWVAATVLLIAPLVARAQDSPAASAPASGASAPAPPAPTASAPPEVSQLTLDDIGQRAEDVAGQLRSMIEAISDTATFTVLEDEVFHASHRVSDRWRETEAMLAGPLRRGQLVTLASSWRALRTELIDVRDEVDVRAQRREADLAALARLKDSWTWTLQHASSLHAPDPLLERVRATLAAIDATTAQVDARHKRVLVLQDAVSRAMQACDDAAARIQDARRTAIDRIFSTRTAPIWQLAREPVAPDAVAKSVRETSGGIAAAYQSVKIYSHAFRSRLVLSLLIGALLIWVLVRARAAASRAHQGAVPEFVGYVLETPLASAIIVGAIATRPLRPDPPFALVQLIYLFGIPAATIVLRRVLDRRLLPAVYALGFLFVVDFGHAVLRIGPLAEQILLVVEMASATALLLWMAANLRDAVGPLVERLPWIRTGGRQIVRLAAVATACGAAGALLGYLELADFVGGGALALVYLGLGILAFQVAAGGLLWVVLIQSPLARLQAVSRSRVRLEAAINRVLSASAIGLWFLLALQRYELLDPTLAWISAALAAQLHVGELSLSLGRVLGFLAVVVGAWVLARIVVFALEEDVYPRMRLARGVPYALSSLVRYGLLLAGFFAALATLGLDLTRLTVLVSAFGLGIGFGMQQVINNFVSGLILLFERPVQVGDLVQLKDLNGEVLRIGIRASRIRTSDGADVIIPNSEIVQNQVTNWTLSDRRRRVGVKVGVAYGTPAERVLALLVEVAKRDARVMEDPAPVALFDGFGASALEFELLFWTEDSRWTRLRSDIGVALQSALREAGVGIPVTPVDVQIETPLATGKAPR